MGAGATAFLERSLAHRAMGSLGMSAVAISVL